MHGRSPRRRRRREGGGYKAGRDIDAKQREELMKLYGFDKPAHERYFKHDLDFVPPLTWARASCRTRPCGS
jgi:ABC-type microcin C transport system permease subunit YejB